MPDSPYDAVVFAGGGCRCAWQVGFWQSAAPAIGLAPRTVAAVSAGAAMACAIFAGATEEMLAEFKARTAANPRNAYPLNLLRRAPVFPHAAIYRDTMLACLDAERVRRLHAGPEIRVLIARVPPWLGPRSGVALALCAYQLGQWRRAGLHQELGRQAGFTPEVYTLRDCRTPAEVAELILQSSCTPPFTPVLRRGGRPVLDGGLIDSVPVASLPPGTARTLVLLTKHCPPGSVPSHNGRRYVHPSQPVPVSKWDYTSPQRVQATYDLGRRDGERFARDFHAHG
ncbi:MAG: patatin-like phospholipase family protein [Deltaproteobacteria bacterium]|nr:patatin-like phospholipase family protein [Deltaproteobacteria bacterium]